MKFSTTPVLLAAVIATLSGTGGFVLGAAQAAKGFIRGAEYAYERVELPSDNSTALTEMNNFCLVLDFVEATLPIACQPFIHPLN